MGLFRKVIIMQGYLTQPVVRSTIRSRALARILTELHTDGLTGGTVSLTSDSLPTNGYYVGGASWTLVIQPEKLNASHLSSFFADHPHAEYIGWWIHHTTGRVYIDVSTHVPERLDAIRLGAQRGEFSIYDIDNNGEIYM
jgi:hypothetical protein